MNQLNGIKKMPKRMYADINFLMEDGIISNISEVQIPRNIIKLSLRKMGIREIPRNYFLQFTNLEEIDLYANCLVNCDFDLPSSVTAIDLSYNKISNIDGLRIDHLEQIDLSYNFLKEYPAILRNTRIVVDIEKNDFNDKIEFLRTMIAEQFGQNQDLVVAPIQGRALNQVINPNQIHALAQAQAQDPIIGIHVIPTNNAQNVHETSIQHAVRETLNKIFYDYDYSYDENYLENLANIYVKSKKIKEYLFFDPRSWFDNRKKMLYNKLKELLRIYEGVQSYIEIKNRRITLSNILERIHAFITRETDEDVVSSMIENLYLQMEDGKNVCFVGKYTRLVNTFTSFVSNISIEIPINEQIGSFILKNRNKDLNVLKQELKEFLKLKKVPEDSHKDWINSLEYL